MSYRWCWCCGYPNEPDATGCTECGVEFEVDDDLTCADEGSVGE